MMESQGVSQLHATAGDSPAEGEVRQESSSPQKKKEPFNLWRLILLVFFGTLLYLGWQTISINRYGFKDKGKKADCAIVLGGAAWHDKPSPVLQERLNHAIKLYEEGRVQALVLTGGKGQGAEYSEGWVARDYCIDHGVPASVIHIEEKSKTTAENLAEAKTILDEQNLKSALIVSDPWHLKRGVRMARSQGIDASPSGTKTSKFKTTKSRANFVLRELYLYHVFLILGR